MTKRLLDCTASELSRFTSRELLGSIAGCEGRVLACETIGVTPPLLGDVTNAEYAAALSADILLLNMFDVQAPVLQALPKTAPQNTVRELKRLTGRVIAVNSLSRDIACGRCEIDEAFRRLETIEAIPFYPPWMRVLVTGLGCAGFGFILGGDFFDSVISFLSGAILSCFLIYADRRKLSKIIANLMASALVTLCGLTFFHLGLGNHIDKIIIGSLMPLVPGVALTTSIRDFLNTDYLSGMIRLIDTLLVASCIAIGVGAVLGAASLFLGVVV